MFADVYINAGYCFFMLDNSYYCLIYLLRTPFSSNTNNQNSKMSPLVPTMAVYHCNEAQQIRNSISTKTTATAKNA